MQEGLAALLAVPSVARRPDGTSHLAPPNVLRYYMKAGALYWTFPMRYMDPLTDQGVKLRPRRTSDYRTIARRCMKAFRGIITSTCRHGDPLVSIYKGFYVKRVKGLAHGASLVAVDLVGG
jgi:hypothetical protein